MLAIIFRELESKLFFCGSWRALSECDFLTFLASVVCVCVGGGGGGCYPPRPFHTL